MGNVRWKMHEACENRCSSVDCGCIACGLSQDETINVTFSPFLHSAHLLHFHSMRQFVPVPVFDQNILHGVLVLLFLEIASHLTKVRNALRKFSFDAV